MIECIIKIVITSTFFMSILINSFNTVIIIGRSFGQPTEPLSDVEHLSNQALFFKLSIKFHC